LFRLGLFAFWIADKTCFRLIHTPECKYDRWLLDRPLCSARWTCFTYTYTVPYWHQRLAFGTWVRSANNVSLPNP